eukprot:SAG31_NODE_3197_length_4567_cov_2.365040_2_plen_84_part_00
MRWYKIGEAVQNRAHRILRIVVARRRCLQSGNICCKRRKVNFGRPRHALRRVHMGKIIDQTPQATHALYAHNEFSLLRLATRS